MFNRIRNWWHQRLVKQTAEKTMATLKISTAPQTPQFQIWNNTDTENSLMFTGSDGETIFSINQHGEAEWHKEDAYNEAAEMFLTYMTMQVEDAAGIAQNRVEWEERITEKLVKQAEIAPLGPQELTDTIRKCIMYDKLKGTKN